MLGSLDQPGSGHTLCSEDQGVRCIPLDHEVQEVGVRPVRCASDGPCELLGVEPQLQVVLRAGRMMGPLKAQLISLVRKARQTCYHISSPPC